MNTQTSPSSSSYRSFTGQQETGFSSKPNFSSQSGFSSGNCLEASAIDDCPPAAGHNANILKSFVYTILAFTALCLASYVLSA